MPTPEAEVPLLSQERSSLRWALARAALAPAVLGLALGMICILMCASN